MCLLDISTQLYPPTGQKNVDDKIKNYGECFVNFKTTLVTTFLSNNKKFFSLYEFLLPK